MRIEIQNAEAETRQVVSRRTGNPVTFREQQGYVHLEGKAYPVEFNIPLGDNQKPYPVGDYELDEKSFSVSRFGNLEVNNRTFRLNPA